ncbi:MAG: UPF0182 family membrane protein [Actinomycetota bacterium]
MENERFPWESLFRRPGRENLPFGRRREGKDEGGGLRERWEKISPRTKWVVGVIVLVLLVLVLSASWLSTFYTDYLWYKEVGYTSVFWKRVVTQVWLFFVFAALFFALFYGNIYLAKRLTPRYERPPSELSPVEESVLRFREGAGRWLDRGLLVGSVLVSLLVGWGSAAQWENVLKFFNHASFGRVDPIFGKDLGFYLFEFPLLRYFSGWLFTVLIFAALAAVAVHFLYGAINFGARGRRFAPHVKAHISVLAGLLLLVQAWRFRLDMFALLHSHHGPVAGATYTDVHARIPAYWILIATSLVCAALFLLNIRYRGWRLPLAGVVGIVVISLLAGSLYPFIVQTYVVKPKELARESEYIEYNIEFTQDAYRIQDEGEEATVERRLFPAENDLTYQDLENNAATVNNIRLWDPRLVQQVYNQRQELRQEYEFADVDVDRYTVFDGVYTQMLLSGREMNVDQLREDARSWQNIHLSYTHGYGLVMSPANQMTQEGDPVLVARDIPPVSAEGLGVEVTRPEIYYGERAHDYVVVRTGAPEIDYPLGNTNKFVEPYYKGEGGIPVSSFLRRLAFSIRNRDISFLFSGYIHRDSRLMFRRGIRERALEVAPFLRLDGDPYLVVTDEGRLAWILDAYTTSDLYPYSESYNGEFNYIRNSVKVVIDAYDGRLTYYLADPADPIALTYGKIFPGLLAPLEEMPEDLKRHVRYPEDLFSVQMEMFRTYHIDDVNAFYQKEDVWDVSTETYGAGAEPQPVTPYYVILKIPGEEREEMVIMLPFNPRGKDNMVDWVAARCDFPHYGKLLNFSFPAGKLVNGTQQFESLVDQKTEISEQITLWNQAGSRVIRGNTLVIPIEDSLIYVEPLYLLATNPAIPQLRRVIVGYGDRVEMKPTLQDALQALFGEQPTPQPQPQPPTQPQPQPKPEGDLLVLVVEANRLYDEAQAALRAGDWAAYGERMDQLSRVLDRMSELTGATTP